MVMLSLGLVIFLGVHSISIVANPWRDAMVARLGENAWKGIYSLLSVVGFVLVVMGYGAARREGIILWSPPFAMRHAMLLFMVPFYPLLLATYLPGRIRDAVKHPMLASVKLWALAHLMVNGGAQDLLLFGALLIWAVADRISVKRRPGRLPQMAPPGKWNDLICVVGGIGLYVFTLLFAHRWLFGVAPLG